MTLMAELAILKDADRETAYLRERDALLAEHETMTREQVDKAIDSKVMEMRDARQKATGQSTC